MTKLLKSFLLEVSLDLHLQWKVQSALRGFSMNKYVVLALQKQIEKDKNNIGKAFQPQKEAKDESVKTDL